MTLQCRAATVPLLQERKLEAKTHGHTARHLLVLEQILLEDAPRPLPFLLLLLLFNKSRHPPPCPSNSAAAAAAAAVVKPSPALPRPPPPPPLVGQAAPEKRPEETPGTSGRGVRDGAVGAHGHHRLLPRAQAHLPPRAPHPAPPHPAQPPQDPGLRLQVLPLPSLAPTRLAELPACRARARARSGHRF